MEDANRSFQKTWLGQVYSTHIQPLAAQLCPDVRQVVGDDVQQTGSQKHTTSKTADETQHHSVGFCENKEASGCMKTTKASAI